MAEIEAMTDPVLLRRARHVVTENARVLGVVAALRAGDLVEVGRIVDDAHASMRHDFEASTAGVDAVVARVRAVPGVLGARLTGGGWGGCVVAVAEAGTRVSGGWLARPASGATVTA
jgi:galactokinase